MKIIFKGVEKINDIVSVAHHAQETFIIDFQYIKNQKQFENRSKLQKISIKRHKYS